MALAKVTLKSEYDGLMTVQFNPKELSLSKSVPWEPQASSGADTPEQQFNTGQGRTLTFELFFDRYEQNASVRGDVAQVENKSSIEVATDAPGSTVYLWNGKSVYHVAVADKDGDATFSIAPSTGDISVTVAGANLNSTSQKVSLAK